MSGLTGYCTSGHHDDCPDSKRDRYQCDCPCHLISDPAIRRWYGIEVDR